MAFTPEDGTGLAAANSLVSLAYAETYWTDRPRRAALGWAVAGVTNAQKQEALMSATQRLNAEAWKGTPYQIDQGTCLPRYFPTIDGLYFDDGMPRPILEACCELANEDLVALLDPSTSSGGELEAIGPISFFANDEPDETTYPRPAKMIAPFLDSTPGQVEAILA